MVSELPWLLFGACRLNDSKARSPEGRDLTGSKLSLDAKDLSGVSLENWGMGHRA